MMNKSTLGVPMGCFCFIFCPFRDPFGHRFFDVFQNKFTKTYKNQCIFNDFASQTPSFFGLFFVDFSCSVRNPFWKAFLAPKTPTYTPKVDFWNHLGFPRLPKMTFGATLLSQKGSKGRVLFPGVASFSRPCFSRNHSNLCAVGTWCF